MAIGQFNTPVFDTSNFENLIPGTPEYEAAKQRSAKMKGYMDAGIGMNTPSGGSSTPTMMQTNSGLFKQQSNPQSIRQDQGENISRGKDLGENISRGKDQGQDAGTTTTTKPATTTTTAAAPVVNPPSTAAQPIDYHGTFTPEEAKINVYQDRRTTLIKQLNDTKDPEARTALHKQISEVERAISQVYRDRSAGQRQEKATAVKEKQAAETTALRNAIRTTLQNGDPTKEVSDQEIDTKIAMDKAQKKAERDQKTKDQIANWKKEHGDDMARGVTIDQYGMVHDPAKAPKPPEARQSTEDFVRGRRNQYDQKAYALFANGIITQDDLNRMLRQEPNHPAMDAIFGQQTGTFTNSGDGPDQHGKNPGAFVPPTDTTATPRPGDTQAPTSRGPERPLRPLQDGGGLAPIPEGQTTAQAQRIGSPGERMAQDEKAMNANQQKNEQAVKQDRQTAGIQELMGPVNPDYVDGKGVDTRDTETGGQQGMENATSVEDFIYGLLNDPTGVGSAYKPQAPMGAKKAKQDKDNKLKSDVAKLKKKKPKPQEEGGMEVPPLP